MKKSDSLPGSFHLQQFPHAEDYMGEDRDRNPQWWELPEVSHEHAEHYARGGSVISQLRKRGAAPGNLMRLHPAMKIPGVHIITSEAGDPFFHGDE